MDENAIEEFKDLVQKLNSSRSDDYSPDMVYRGMIIDYDEETWIDEAKNYFFGEVGHGHDAVILKFMKYHKFDDDEYVLVE